MNLVMRVQSNFADITKNNFADITKNDVFDQIVSAWDEPLSCQTAQSARPCRNPARWLAIEHGCGCWPNVVVCTFHKTRWLRIVGMSIAYRGWFRCGQCGKRFTTSEQSVTFRPA